MAQVSITVTVPEELVADVYHYVAELHEGPAEDEVDWEEGEEEVRRRPPGTSPNRVKQAYRGGNSDVWRPFLDYLADQPDEWVPWGELCEAIGLTRRQASGMLGAAERRLKQKLPYEKRTVHGEREFRMSADVADTINTLREE